jgi:hypothetical protein
MCQLKEVQKPTREWACRVHLCVSTCPAQSTGLVNVVSTVKAPVAQSFMQVTGLLFVFIAHELFTVVVQVGFSVPVVIL